MKVLVDGDILVYRCGFAVEKNKYNVFIKGEEHFGPVAVYRYKKEIPKYYTDDAECYLVKEKELEPLENALQATKELLRSIVLAVGASSYQVYLTGKGNYREALAVTKPYKGNRDPDYKPVYYNEIREYLIKHWGAEVVDGMETDDALGIEQTRLRKEAGLI